MRIVIANVNTTRSVTDAIVAGACRAAAPGTDIVGLTPYFGSPSVEGNFESLLAAAAVMDRVVSYDQAYDAVVLAGYGEHGREGLQELVDVPVIDIAEAGALIAMLLGHRFSVVTTLARMIPLITDRLRLTGVLDRCASVRASGLGVLELEEDPERARSAIAAQALAAVREDGAEVICLGCAGMVGLQEAVQERVRVPVVDPVTAAVKLAEALTGLGLRTSKVGAFQAPRPKARSGWPISAAAEPRTT